MSIQEKSFFFENGNYSLLGFLHSPGHQISNKGLILCPPFGEEKQESHRVMVNLARRLAESGFTVFRFDLYGTGDSGGEWHQATVHEWLSDIHAAVEWLGKNTNVKSPGLLGLRFGGTLAAMVAEKTTSVRFLVLWSPIVRVEAYLYECLRTNLSAQLVLYRSIQFNREQLLSQMMKGEKINLDGYLLTREFYESAKNMTFSEEGMEFQGPALIIQLSGKDSKPDQELISLHTRYFVNNPKSAFLEVLTHPFWNEPLKFYDDSPHALFVETLEWMKSLD